MSDFSDRPFVAGSLTGIRSFKVDRYGRLAGVTYTDVWTPGENVAKCHRDLTGGVLSSFVSGITGTYTVNAYYGGPITFPVAMAPTISKPPPVSLVKKPKHRVAGLTCQCGFYAYFDNGSNPHHSKGQIKGIVEGYGTTTVGTRGFRSERATLRALVIPSKRRSETVVERLIANYGVPVFESKSEALAHHPLTPPPIPSPESDPEFWTRGAVL